ncbi:hypothetical protein, partial [Erwinia sp. V71]|uniref:hypothetical protein n=1 Tax=Erwinia sp. V71 TaxID=3369424 RepID=UPI003F630627
PAGQGKPSIVMQILSPSPQSRKQQRPHGIKIALPAQKRPLQAELTPSLIPQPSCFSYIFCRYCGLFPYNYVV